MREYKEDEKWVELVIIIVGVKYELFLDRKEVVMSLFVFEILENFKMIVDFVEIEEGK